MKSKEKITERERKYRKIYGKTEKEPKKLRFRAAARDRREKIQARGAGAAGSGGYGAEGGSGSGANVGKNAEVERSAEKRTGMIRKYRKDYGEKAANRKYFGRP